MTGGEFFHRLRMYLEVKIKVKVKVFDIAHCPESFICGRCGLTRVADSTLSIRRECARSDPAGRDSRS